MTRELIIFDLDGTLIDSRADLCLAANAMRREYGLPALSLETVSSYVGNGMRKLVERSLGEAGVDLDQAVDCFRVHYDRHLHDRTTLYPGVEEGLARLAAKERLLAVSSNKPGPWCRRLMGHFRLTPRFFCVVGAGDAPRLKPDPAQLLLIRERAGRRWERAVMVGDNYTDLEAGRRAGMLRVFVRWGIGRADPEIPDWSVESFPELVDRLLAAGG